jgi:hypothetical protein
MMHPRWLALPLAVLTASATVSGCATAPPPRMLSADLHIGSLDDRTSFELDDSGKQGSGSAAREGDDDLDDIDEGTDTPKKQRVRRLLYLTGLGAIGFGIVGTVGFGIGGRIVQAQMKNGYEDGDLTREREDQLSTTGTVMNALAITSAVVGIVGLITAATVYGIDHARCGELRPRRKQCAGPKGEGTVSPGAGGAPASEGGATSDPGTAGAADGATDPGAGNVSKPDGSTTAPPVGPSPAPPGPSPAGGRPTGPTTGAGTQPGGSTPPAPGGSPG